MNEEGAKSEKRDLMAQEPKVSIPVYTCLAKCVPCDIGMHEICDNRMACECTHLTWADVTKKQKVPAIAR
jgi:hypothetical protein